MQKDTRTYQTIVKGHSNSKVPIYWGIKVFFVEKPTLTLIEPNSIHFENFRFDFGYFVSQIFILRRLRPRRVKIESKIIFNQIYLFSYLYVRSEFHLFLLLVFGVI